MKRFVLVGVKDGKQEIIPAPKGEVDSFRFLKSKLNECKATADCGGFDEVMLFECIKYTSKGRTIVMLANESLEPDEKGEPDEKKDDKVNGKPKRNPFGVER